MKLALQLMRLTGLSAITGRGAVVKHYDTLSRSSTSSVNLLYHSLNSEHTRVDLSVKRDFQTAFEFDTALNIGGVTQDIPRHSLFNSYSGISWKSILGRA
ncbi:hypothetical protein GCK32_001346 [Trichostrongylus colubriformis]|uniref:Uncharacterized protein n=1 Tax=Trichostrongylus colubriformis TaxID=6319 RepID=A0AAN8IBH0_TRICO